jgi:hypothetical protein
VGSRQAIVLVAVVLCCACAPTVHRPLEGAPPIGQGGAASPNQAGGPPPTLSPPTPSPAAAEGQAGASVSGPAPSPSPSPEPGYYIAATDGRGVNLREGPSTSARVIVTLAEGTAIEVFDDSVPGTGGPWRRVRSGNREGWIVSGVIRRR